MATRRRIGKETITGVIVGYDMKVVPPKDVQKLAAMGCTHTEIANFYGINIDTMRKQFEHELQVGKEELKQRLRRAQIEHALNGNATLLIWLGKNYLGQSDNPVDSDANAPLPWVE